MIYYHYGSKLGCTSRCCATCSAPSERARARSPTVPAPRRTKLDAWIVTMVEEAAARPWFPPIMLRELASGASHIDNETFGMMNAVYLAVRDVIVQGQREGTFRSADPLLTYLTILPSILIFFARQRVVAQRKNTPGPRGGGAA